MANLPDRIKELRLSANMTQTEFGEKFGIVKSTVSLYESGKSTPNDQIKKAICSFFDVSVDYLMGNDAALSHTSPILALFQSYETHGMTEEIRAELLRMFPELADEELTEEEKRVLDAFRRLSRDNKDIVIGDMKRYIKEEREEMRNEFKDGKSNIA